VGQGMMLRPWSKVPILWKDWPITDLRADTHSPNDPPYIFGLYGLYGEYYSDDDDDHDDGFRKGLETGTSRLAVPSLPPPTVVREDWLYLLLP